MDLEKINSAIIFKMFMKLKEDIQYIALYCQETDKGFKVLITQNEKKFNQIINLTLKDYLKLPTKPIAELKQIQSIDKKIYLNDLNKLVAIWSDLLWPIIYKPIKEIIIITQQEQANDHIKRIDRSKYLITDTTEINKIIEDYKTIQHNDIKEQQWKKINNQLALNVYPILINAIIQKHNLELKYYFDENSILLLTDPFT